MTTEQRENRIQSVGRRLLEEARAAQASWLRQRWWFDQVLRLTMADPGLKTALFRFIDVLPALRTPDQVASHVKAYFSSPESHFPQIIQWAGSFASRSHLSAAAEAALVRQGASRIARTFIAGSSLAQAAAVTRRLWERGMAFTLAPLGEAVVSEAEAAHYQEVYLAAIETMAERAAGWPASPLLDSDGWHRLPRANISVKSSSLYSRLDPADPDGGAAVVKGRLRLLLRRAVAAGAFLNLDMEEYRTKEIAVRAFRELLMEDEFRGFADAGIVVQAYLRDSPAELEALISWARRRGAPITIRLVKGAYWDYEVVIARQHGWEPPVFTAKWETDANFERLTRVLLAAHPQVKTAIGTHNIRSLVHAMVSAEASGLAPDAWEVQMLYGMGDPIQQAVVSMGRRLRIYAPYGELIPGMAYLVRRLLENTSNESFLRQSFLEEASPEALLQNPTVGRGILSPPNRVAVTPSPPS